MKRLILLNSPVLTTFGTFEFVRISVDEARKIIQEAKHVESAIGHQSTADIMSELLDFNVKTNRIEFFQTENDTAFIFRLKKRIGEGQILNREEIEKIGYEFGILRRLK